MPELHVERRPPAIPWWAWLLGALLLVLVIWGVLAAVRPDPRAATVTPQEQAAGTREAGGDTGAVVVLPIVAIVAQPTGYAGQTVSGTATVGEVVSDRGFWLREGDQRIFTVIDEPPGETKDINEGQRVRLTGTVYDAQGVGQVSGLQNLETDARQILQKEPVVLYVRAQDLTILAGDQAAATPGQATQPGQVGAVSLTDVFANPANHVGQSVSGTARVANDVSDRGFWIEDNGRRLFAVIDEPSTETIDINGGQQIRFSGTVIDATRAAQIPGVQALEQETQQILKQQPASLLVKARDITILSRPGQ